MPNSQSYQQKFMTIFMAKFMAILFSSTPATSWTGFDKLINYVLLRAHKKASPRAGFFMSFFTFSDRGRNYRFHLRTGRKQKVLVFSGVCVIVSDTPQNRSRTLYSHGCRGRVNNVRHFYRTSPVSSVLIGVYLGLSLSQNSFDQFQRKLRGLSLLSAKAYCRTFKDGVATY